MFEIAPYLERIYYRGSPHPTVATLRELQKQHLTAVPFENLDIHYDIPIRLDIERFYIKIVLQNRGGFCYELNGLFHKLLRELGFNARIISAQVYDRDDSEFGPEFDHLAIIATVNRREWLVDVGFGDFTLPPLLLPDDSREVQEDSNGMFRVTRVSGERILVEHATAPGSWVPEYRFRPVERTLGEFKDRCQYHQTSENSHFTHKNVCSRIAGGGRITLTDSKLRVRDSNGTQVQKISSNSMFRSMLKLHFNIELEM
ncbi:MAG: arylamine N-acetyltransferase [Balneolaceae bacterium]|nr:arylamine N-acetyltransferase [Balneolaceae bacterium]